MPWGFLVWLFLLLHFGSCWIIKSTRTVFKKTFMLEHSAIDIYNGTAYAPLQTFLAHLPRDPHASGFSFGVKVSRNHHLYFSPIIATSMSWCQHPEKKILFRNLLYIFLSLLPSESFTLSSSPFGTDPLITQPISLACHEFSHPDLPRPVATCRRTLPTVDVHCPRSACLRLFFDLFVFSQ